jgi:hypothetical protein
MGKQFRILLDSREVGVLLDALRARHESWQNTASFLEAGQFSDGVFICEECNDADEAASVARHFAELISRIERQVEAQGGWS